MEVLLVNKFFYEKGGTERYFFLLTQALERRGHDVVHFSMQHPNNRPSPYAGYFVAPKDYDTPRGVSGAVAHVASFIRSREAARNIRALIRAFPPRVAHLHNIYHQITPSILKELEAAGVPVVMTLHDYKLVCPNYSLFAGGEFCYRCKGGRFYNAPLTRCSGGSFSRSALLAFEAYWQRMSGVYKSVRKFIAPSRFMRDVIAGARVAGPDADGVVYLPGFLPPAGDQAESSDAAGDGGGAEFPETYVLYFGRLSPEKGIHTLLEAAGERPNIPFVICGDGPDSARLRRMAEAGGLGNVLFTGYVQKPRLEGIVKRARVVVLPTLSPENAPFTVLESAAAGVPVIVSDMGGLPEMAEIVGGWVFRRGDCDDLKTKIDDVWSNPERAREIGAKGGEAARGYFDREKHVDALESIYREVLS